ncbi:MAG: hypothetical protein ABR509_04435 [Candidatus Limnocylindria bacterium]
MTGILVFVLLIGVVGGGLAVVTLRRSHRLAIFRARNEHSEGMRDV